MSDTLPDLIDIGLNLTHESFDVDRAAVLERRAQLDQAQREAKRNRVLKDLIAAETVEIGDTQVKRAAAALATCPAAASLPARKLL